VNKYDLMNILTAVGLLSWAAAAMIPLGWELWRRAQNHPAHRDRQMQAANSNARTKRRKPSHLRFV
jgi:hypothetical protein